MNLPTHLFDWPSRHNIHVALPLFLLFSFLLHALGVLVFQITYPRSAAAPPRSAEVVFLQPGSRSAIFLGPRIAASDPALFSPARAEGSEKLSPVGYVPSFDVDKPALKPLPSTTAQPAAPSLLAPGRSKSAPVASPGEVGMPTLVKLGDALSGRTFTPPQGISFHAPPRQSLEAVEFLLAVSPEGKPLYIFQQTASGNEGLDRDARNYLSSSQFNVVQGEAPTWGTARFLWGTDVVRSK